MSKKTTLKKREFAIIHKDKVFVGLKNGGEYIFSEDWSMAKTFDDDRKFALFESMYSGCVKMFL